MPPSRHESTATCCIINRFQMTLESGKLPNSELADIISEIYRQRQDPRLLVGPGIGEDAAQIDFGNVTVIAKSDPITFATDEIGWYAVNVNANDIAATGGTPKWFLATLLMPVGSTTEQVRDIALQLSTAASEINVTIAGGHTEITPAVNRPVICGFMLGEAPAGKAVSTAGARTGDTIILTKGIAIEGTAILAREAPEQLAAAGIDEVTVRRAADLLKSPGISVIPDAGHLISAGGVHAMHDVTEGGIATAAAEMATAANVDIQINPDLVHILPETATICAALKLDPWGLISSGAMLAAVDPKLASQTVDALKSAGIHAAAIGKALEPTAPAVQLLHDDGTATAIKTFERDELACFFDSITT